MKREDRHVSRLHHDFFCGVLRSHPPAGNLPFQCAVGPCGRTGVDVKLVLVLESLKLVCVSRDEDVYVQLPLEERQAGHVAPGDDLVPVDEADLELAHSDHLLLGVVQVLKGNI